MTSRTCTLPSWATPFASRGLCCQTAFQSPMSDQAKSAATTAALSVRSMTAWSKLIFGAAAKLSPRRSAPRSFGALVDRPADGLERVGRQPLDLAQAGVGAEEEHAGVPEGAGGDQLGRLAGVGLLDEALDLVGLGADRLALGDVAVGGGGAGRGDAEHDDPAVLGGAGGGGDGALEGLDVGDQVVRRHDEHDRLRVAAGGEAGGERHRRAGCRGPAARARSRSPCRPRPPGRRRGSARWRR